MKIFLNLLLIGIIITFPSQTKAKVITINYISNKGVVFDKEGTSLKIKNIQLITTDQSATFLLKREIEKYKNKPFNTSYWSSSKQSFDIFLEEENQLLSTYLLSKGLAIPTKGATQEQVKIHQKAKENKNGNYWSPEKKKSKPIQLSQYHSTKIGKIITGNQFISSDGWVIQLIGTSIPSGTEAKDSCFRQNSKKHLQRYLNQKVILISLPQHKTLNQESAHKRWVILQGSTQSLNEEIIRKGHAKQTRTRHIIWDQKLSQQTPLTTRGSFEKCLSKIIGLPR